MTTLCSEPTMHGTGPPRLQARPAPAAAQLLTLHPCHRHLPPLTIPPVRLALTQHSGKRSSAMQNRLSGRTLRVKMVSLMR